MAEQMKALLSDLARQLERQDGRYLALAQEVAALKSDKEWITEASRKTDKRLETGDHTFEAMRAEIREADRIAREALKIAGQAVKSAGNAWRALEPLTKQKPETTIRKKWRDQFIEQGVRIVIGLILIGLYHVLVHGPAIAAAIKAAHGGSE